MDARGVDESHGLLRRVDAHQRRLQFAGQQAAIHLPQQDGHVGVEGRVEIAGQLDGVEELQTVQGVHAERGQRRLNEAQPGDNLHRQAGLGRPGEDGRHRGLAHKWVAGHGVDHVAGAPQPQDLRGDAAIDGGEVLGRVVDVVEAVQAQVGRQAGHRRVAAGAQDNGIGRGKEMPGLTGDQAGISGAETNDGDGHLELTVVSC